MGELISFNKMQEKAAKGMMRALGVDEAQAMGFAIVQVTRALAAMGPPPAYVERFTEAGWTTEQIAEGWAFTMQCAASLGGATD